MKVNDIMVFIVLLYIYMFFPFFCRFENFKIRNYVYIHICIYVHVFLPFPEHLIDKSHTGRNADTSFKALFGKLRTLTLKTKHLSLHYTEPSPTTIFTHRLKGILLFILSLLF